MKNFRMFLWMTFLTGVIYPMLITGIVKLTMKAKADGSFITSKKGLIGSQLIAQKFESDKYFWGRPSAIDYNPLPSGGSNLGPTSAVLKKAVEARKEKYSGKDKVPSELLFASGSGLDPHITPLAAYFQLNRVAKARGMNEEKIKKLIDDQVIRKPLGFLGEDCVNVLILNKTLDEI